MGELVVRNTRLPAVIGRAWDRARKLLAASVFVIDSACVLASNATAVVLNRVGISFQDREVTMR
jgi:hypothetical protein